MSTIKAVEGLAKPEMLDGRSEFNAATPEDFAAGLRWIASQGKEETLDLLRGAEKAQPFSSVEIKRLFEIARDEITTRAFDSSRQLQNFFGVTEAEFAQLVGSKEGSAMARSRVEDLRLIKESWEAMFYPSDAPVWFRSPVPRFDGRTPMEMVREGGAGRVAHLLSRLELGIHN